MEYVKSHSLFDPQNPTNIQLDDKIQVALGLTNESTLTLFDFIDRIKDIIQDG
jgi:chromatin remodeling complex protein RSC6